MGSCNDQGAVAVEGSAGVCRVSSGVYAYVLTDENGVISEIVPPALVSELASHPDALQWMRDFHGIELGTTHADAMGVRNMLPVPSRDGDGNPMNWTREDIEFFRGTYEGWLDKKGDPVKDVKPAKAGSNGVTLSVNDPMTGVIAVDFAKNKRENVRNLIVALRGKMGSDKRYKFAVDTLSRHYTQEFQAAAMGDPLFKDYQQQHGDEMPFWLQAVIGGAVGITVFGLGALFGHILVEAWRNWRGPPPGTPGGPGEGDGSQPTRFPEGTMKRESLPEPEAPKFVPVPFPENATIRSTSVDWKPAAYAAGATLAVAIGWRILTRGKGGKVKAVRPKINFSRVAAGAVPVLGAAAVGITVINSGGSGTNAGANASTSGDAEDFDVYDVDGLSK